MEIAYTIAASDSSAGAGLQADIKTMQALGVHACSIVTATTAQNSKTVSSIIPLNVDELKEQLTTTYQDYKPKAIKIGLVPKAEQLRAIKNFISETNAYIVMDPVFKSSTQDLMIQEEDYYNEVKSILPHINLLCPNIEEAEKITGLEIRSCEQMLIAARSLITMGLKAVLIKGSHLNSEFAQDLYLSASTEIWFNSRRIKTQSKHGTGCTLSSAITAAVAKGHTALDAITIAKAYINQAISKAPDFKLENGPLYFGPAPEDSSYMPWLSHSANFKTYQFPKIRELGFYAIVDNLKLLEELLNYGVKTIQLRVKDLDAKDLETIIAGACKLAKEYQAQLFINDYWQLAIKYQAFGVHLGQLDLPLADIKAIEQAGLHLGISTHSHFEIAWALAYQPSYIAIGPIFPTTTKEMPFTPHGISGLRYWRKLLEGYPLVAIAGIFLDNAAEVLSTGVDGLAVVRDIANAKNREQRTKEWLTLFTKQYQVA